MTSIDAVFREASAHPGTKAVPLGHLSIELGHLYAEDYDSDPDFLRRHFSQIRPWVDAAVQAASVMLPKGRRARVSTCFLVDDYFTPFSTPAAVIPELTRAAEECGITIDYLARESGCADADGIPLAQLVEGRLVQDPAPGTNGARPTVAETGWICNGQRSPSAASAAMQAEQPWQPPAQNGAVRHGIFSDVQLWDGDGDNRIWSCPYLAAVWQLQRLGLLRYFGQPTASPQDPPNRLPSDWADLPAIVRLNPAAEAFSAYRTMSILAPRFLAVEQAVRTILSQVSIDGQVANQVAARSQGESVPVAVELVDRVEYVFSGASVARR